MHVVIYLFIFWYRQLIIQFKCLNVVLQKLQTYSNANFGHQLHGIIFFPSPGFL